jgi:Double zinc ribbon
MKCPKCQTENLADSAFCEECGAPLEAACPACGTGNRPTAKFCRKCRAALVDSQESIVKSPQPALSLPKHLADKILTSRAALEGERKQGAAYRSREPCRSGVGTGVTLFVAMGATAHAKRIESLIQ